MRFFPWGLPVMPCVHNQSLFFVRPASVLPGQTDSDGFLCCGKTIFIQAILSSIFLQVNAETYIPQVWPNPRAADELIRSQSFAGLRHPACFRMGVCRGGSWYFFAMAGCCMWSASASIKSAQKTLSSILNSQFSILN